MGNEDEPLDLKFEQFGQLHGFELWIALPGHEHRVVVAGANHRVGAPEHLGKDRVVQLGHVDADGAAFAIREAARRCVGSIPELGCRLLDRSPARVADLRRTAHRERHQRLGNPRSCGDVVNSGAALIHW